MEHKPVEKLRSVAEVHEYKQGFLSRRERLERWAEILERRPKRRLRSLGEIEFTPDVDVAGEPGTQRAAGSPLAGPTLDGVVSRVWEGLVMRLPAACPVCHGEVQPAVPGSLGGNCTSCGTSID